MIKKIIQKSNLYSDIQFVFKYDIYIYISYLDILWDGRIRTFRITKSKPASAQD
jgi:hypothetical protein